MEAPKVRYARSQDGAFIAHQSFGRGGDLLLILPFVSHLDLIWDVPPIARMLRDLGAFARVTVMDQRGVS